jgi:hypothetical protein
VALKVPFGTIYGGNMTPRTHAQIASEALRRNAKMAQAIAEAKAAFNAIIAATNSPEIKAMASAGYRALMKDFDEKV